MRDGFSALPVVEARPCGGFVLVGWVTREQMVERVYRQQRRAFEEARVRTSLGARVQRRWGILLFGFVFQSFYLSLSIMPFENC